jgi:hypothetical protein
MSYFAILRFVVCIIHYDVGIVLSIIMIYASRNVMKTILENHTFVGHTVSGHQSILILSSILLFS